MMHRLLVVFALMIIAGCREKPATQAPQQKPVYFKPGYNVKTDIRFGKAFYSIYLNEQGEVWVAKGIGSKYTTDFTEIDSAEKSQVFKIDSVAIFYKNIKKIAAAPIIRTVSTTDAARIEIYYNRTKIYDDYTMTNEFWNLYKPVFKNLPKEFNPIDPNESLFFK